MDQRALRATWLFTAAIAVVGCGLALVVSQIAPNAGRPFVIGWPLLAVAFGLAERYSVEIEVRREAQSLNFSEIPLTIGLIFADPLSVLIARLVGATVVFVVTRRLPPVKLAFNLANFAAETSAAIIVYHAIIGSAVPIEPRGWLAAFAAIGVSSLLTWTLVTTVIYLAGAPVTLHTAFRYLLYAQASGMPACAVALGASSAVWLDGRSWILLAIIGVALGFFFLSYIRIRERHQSLSALHEFTTKIERVSDRRVLVSESLRGITDLLRAERTLILLPIDGGFEKYELGEDGDAVAQPIEVKVDDFDLPLALSASMRPGSEQRGAPAVAGIDLSQRDTMAARLQLGDRQGLVLVDGRIAQNRAFDDEDFQILETAVGHVSSAMRNAGLVSELRSEARYRAHQALNDDVTELPNQRALVEQLAGQLADHREVAMVTVRVNSLREVNETLGRSMGDEMLRQVAARLRPVGRRAWCARSATDEFTLIVPGGQVEADEFAERIVESFADPVLCDDVALAVIVGIGIALAPIHGTDSETLLRRASLAASRSTVEGTTVTTWAADRDPYDPQRLTIAADLRDAIPAGELEVHFQPQFDVVNGLVTGAEALVRWRHPRLGQLRPDQFIPAAENTGAIDALTLHVLTVAAMTGARWRDRGWDLDMAVNLSARNLTNPGFAADVAVILERTGLPAGSLTMELTESSVMTEAERALRTLRELDELGIAISIDDFGTGYSSLAHLRRLPVGEIKIDKSFVFDLTTSESDEAIVRSMIELGHNLGLTVVVEGVETVEVRDRLHELGTDRLQGYLLSRPLPVEAFELWVAERPMRTLTESVRDRVVQLQHRR